MASRERSLMWRKLQKDVRDRDHSSDVLWLDPLAAACVYWQMWS
jgi:hypothetical protein